MTDLSKNIRIQKRGLKVFSRVGMIRLLGRRKRGKVLKGLITVTTKNTTKARTKKNFTQTILALTKKQSKMLRTTGKIKGKGINRLKRISMGAKGRRRRGRLIRRPGTSMGRRLIMREILRGKRTGEREREIGLILICLATASMTAAFTPGKPKARAGLTTQSTGTAIPCSTNGSSGTRNESPARKRRTKSTHPVKSRCSIIRIAGSTRMRTCFAKREMRRSGQLGSIILFASETTDGIKSTMILRIHTTVLSRTLTVRPMSQ